MKRNIFVKRRSQFNHGHIEMGMPLIIVAVILGLITYNLGLATWLSVVLYIVAGLLFLFGFLNMGSTGMAGMSGYSYDSENDEEKRE